MESFWSAFKEKLVHRAHFHSRVQTASAIFGIVAETLRDRRQGMVDEFVQAATGLHNLGVAAGA